MMESRISFKHDTDSQVLMYCLSSAGCPLGYPVKLVGFQWSSQSNLIKPLVLEVGM